MLSSLQSILTPYLGFSAAVISSSMPSTLPLLGAVYPPPTQLAQDGIFFSALDSFEINILNGIRNTGACERASFSISIFSASDADLLYERHNTSELLGQASEGTTKVDSDSIYRIGSISKLVTVYTFLVEVGDRRLNDPITDYVPELLTTFQTSHTAVRPVWQDVTLGELGSHLAGMAREYGMYDLAVQETGEEGRYPRLHESLPPLPDIEKPTCGYVDTSGTYITCDAGNFLSGIANAAAVFPTSYTPTYCNDAFVLLGVALERIKGTEMGNMVKRSLFEPLKLEHSTYSVPPPAKQKLGVIPGNSTACGWNDEFGAFTPAGGNYMSLRDLSALGRSILKHDLLSKSQTRRWLKPRSLLDDRLKAVGMPWEIERVQVEGRTVDLYMKDGDWNVYDSRLVLVPDYQIGFSILTASNSASVKRDGGLKLIEIVAEAFAAKILPALERSSKTRAEKRFAGTYVSCLESVQHSLVIAADVYPGLTVTSWRYNGTDILAELGRTFATKGKGLDFRLQPNDLYQGNRVGFTGLAGSSSWETVDLIKYGNVGIEQFVFKVDEDGVAEELEVIALRAMLNKV